MTTNIDRAAQIIDRLHAADQMAMEGAIGYFNATAAAQALADAGLLAPEPRIIRTREELVALDPDALVVAVSTLTRGWRTLRQKRAHLAANAHLLDLTRKGPLAVIATGEQVRAARQALEEA